MQIKVSSFYRFHPLEREQLSSLKEQLVLNGDRLNLRGLVIISHEGINGTVSADSNQISSFKELLLQIIPALTFKESFCERYPFKRLKVEVRESIVDGGESMPTPKSTVHKHLSPQEWQEWLDSDKEFSLLDVRNDYESEIGVFEGAIAPKIDRFKCLPQIVPELALPKDRPVLMYCTGGIRCEKAILELEQQGYEHVYQLDGGILAYLEHFPNSHFKGECFVFDHRVSVDQTLQPSRRFHFCHRCGQTGQERGKCEYCHKVAYLCQPCSHKFSHLACSKNCDYHLKGGPKAAKRNIKTNVQISQL